MNYKILFLTCCIFAAGTIFTFAGTAGGHSCTATVSIDSISQNDIEKQMETLVIQKINSSGISGIPLQLAITINQRNFFKGFSNLNSIFICYEAMEKETGTTYRGSFSLETKSSAVSGIMQEKTAVRIAKDVERKIRKNSSKEKNAE